MFNTIETDLFNNIRNIHFEIESMTPADGFSTPRDIKLVAKINKLAAISRKMEEALQIILPGFKYDHTLEKDRK